MFALIRLFMVKLLTAQKKRALKEKHMVVNNVSLYKTAVNRSGYPEDIKPEIAFIGRSNVGKSSLINALIYRKSLARTSQSPGKTRTLNFYNVEDILYFVDLPGYGYAKASKSEVKTWGAMIEDYLKNREQLAAVLLLVDSRHQPNGDDILMYEWLRAYEHKIIIAATKTDKLKPNELVKNLRTIINTLKLGEKDVLIPFSAEKKTGRDEMWELFEGLI